MRYTSRDVSRNAPRRRAGIGVPASSHRALKREVGRSDNTGRIGGENVGWSTGKTERPCLTRVKRRNGEVRGFQAIGLDKHRSGMVFAEHAQRPERTAPSRVAGDPVIDVPGFFLPSKQAAKHAGRSALGREDDALVVVSMANPYHSWSAIKTLSRHALMLQCPNRLGSFFPRISRNCSQVYEGSYGVTDNWSLREKTWVLKLCDPSTTHRASIFIISRHLLRSLAFRESFWENFSRLGSSRFRARFSCNVRTRAAQSEPRLRDAVLFIEVDPELLAISPHMRAVGAGNDVEKYPNRRSHQPFQNHATRVTRACGPRT